MKNFSVLIALLLFCGSFAMGQTPNEPAPIQGSTTTATSAKFGYQAVLRHTNSHAKARQLVRNQTGKAKFLVGNEVIADNLDFTTNDNGMTTLTLESPRDFNWRDKVITAVFTLDADGEEITIKTPVTAVPYAIHSDNAVLTTAAIGNYLATDNTDASDMNRIFLSIRANSSVHDAMRDTIVNYIKANFHLTKKIAYHYMHQMTTSDIDEAYAVGQSLDPEVKNAVYNLFKRYLSDNRELLIDITKYYISEATVDEIEQLHDTLENNLSASLKIKAILDQYFEEYLKSLGLWCEGHTVCSIADLINGTPEPEPRPEPEPETFSCGTSKMIDASGNRYETVQIGVQCWTKTNLRTSKFRDGHTVPKDVDPDQSPSASFSRISPEDILSDIPTYTDSTFGFYYNWYAAADTGDSKLCPEGWHVSNEDDWMRLKNYLGTYDYCGSNPTYIAKTLADSLLWAPNDADCSIGKNPENNNASGFSAVPAGYLSFGSQYPMYAEVLANFWIAKPSTESDAKYYSLSRYYADLEDYTNPKSALLSVRCVNDEEYQAFVLPTVTTDSATKVTPTSAKLYGTITNPNNVTITEMGFEWKKNGTSEYASTDVDGAELTTTLGNLTPSTKYFYRAFIKYENRTLYGTERSFTTPIASVTTDSANHVALTEATIYGTVINPNHVEITEKGFVWKKSHGVYEYETVNLTGEDTALIHTFTDLVPNTKYDYKAFIKFDNRTVYGEELSFTTPNHPEVSCGTMTDADGNLYQTVVVGTQCWAKTNLRTTKYRKGSTISNQIGTTVPAYYRLNDFDKDTSVIVSQTTTPDSIFGFYYNGYAAVRDSLCPEGWHVPDTNDWKDLIGYMKVHPEYWCDNDNSNLAKAVASRDFWFNVETPPITYTINHDAVPRPCSPQYQGPDYLNDASYFSAIPAGAWYDNLGGNIDTVTGLGGREFDPGKDAHFWSSSTQPGSDSTGYFFRLGMVTYDVVALAYDALKYGRSVRCLRDESVTDPQAFSCGTSKMIDADDNRYETVMIGDQCWTKTNLRTTKFRDGEAIPENQDASLATASLYRPAATDAVAEHYTDSIYGMYYNWYAVEGGKLCPAGWHVPTQAEWDQLTTYMSSQSGYRCDVEEPTFIAKTLAGTHHYVNQSEETIYAWQNENKSCAAGNDRGNIAKTNTSGFSAFPAGYWKTTFDGYRQSANFWTSTPEDNKAWVYYLLYSQEMLSSYKEDKTTAFSVRCVKN